MRLHPRNVVLLLVFSGLAFASVALERDEQQVQDAGPLLTGFEPARVERVVLTPPGAAALELLRGGPEEPWTLPSRDGFGAYGYAVDELLARVAAVPRSDRVGSEPSSFDAHGVGTAGVRLAFYGGAGELLAELVQGAPAGLATGSNVRLAEGDEVFRASGLQPVGTDPGAWLDAQLVRFDPVEVRGVAISHEGGRIFLDLLRGADGWRVLNDPDKTVPKNLVERVLQVASTLVFTDLIDARIEPKNGFGSPPETLLELDLEGDERAALWIGVPTGDGAYYATNPHWEKSWCAALPSRTAEVLFGAIDALHAASVR
ncbi:MAG: hypothetical protein AAF682_18005 [Planctomycetota bacterium]